MGAIGVVAGLGRVTPLVWGDHMLAGVVVAMVARVCQRDQSRLVQRGKNVSDPGGRGAMGVAG